MLALNSSLIEEIYSPSQAIEDCKKSFSIIASNNYKCPLRSFLKTPNQDLVIMPSCITEEDSKDTQLSIKILSIVPQNKKKGLPLIPGKLLLLDESTGLLKAIMDGGMITNLRTGATAGTSAEILHPNTVNNVVIFGSGAQGKYGLESLLYVHPEIKKITIISPNNSKKFSEEFQKKDKERKYLPALTQKEIEEAVKEADIIHCATTSKEELFKAEWIKEGTHISAIGCYTLEMKEIPKDIFKRKNVKLWVDQYEAMKEEAGDIMSAINEGILKIEDIGLFGNIINGKDKGRLNEKEITIVKFVGVAPQDTVAANSIYKIAKEKGVGIEIDI